MKSKWCTRLNPLIGDANNTASQIVDANNKCSLVGKLPILLWGKETPLDILVITTHIRPITVYVTQSSVINTGTSSSMEICNSFYTQFT
jgi:hypothetical protein